MIKKNNFFTCIKIKRVKYVKENELIYDYVSNTSKIEMSSYLDASKFYSMRVLKSKNKFVSLFFNQSSIWLFSIIIGILIFELWISLITPFASVVTMLQLFIISPVILSIHWSYKPAKENSSEFGSSIKYFCFFFPCLSSHFHS